MARLIEVIKLGTVSYKVGLEIQNRLKTELLSAVAHGKSCKGVLLLLQHFPVYTIGLRNNKYSMEDEIRLRSLGANFHATDRGGLITFHGPGQLVAYPIINLKEYCKGMKAYICKLEKTIISVCQHFNLSASTIKDYNGVWIGDKKIAALGVHGQRFVTSHGLALNCNTDLSWFEHIIPCGIEGKGVTSLSFELMKSITVEDVNDIFLNCFQREFSCQWLSITDCSLDPASIIK